MNFLARMQKILLHPGETAEMRHNTKISGGGGMETYNLRKQLNVNKIRKEEKNL